jgi:hypothetical protein
MSVRVNISVPDSLHIRMQEVKDQINVSAVCSDALEIAVSTQELVNQAQSKAEGERIMMVQRLKAERQQSQNEWLQAGKQEGIEAAGNTSYGDFDLLDAAYTQNHSNPHLTHWSEDLWGRDEFEWIKESASSQEVPESSRNDFYSGVFDGLLEMWLSVKEEVLSEE